MAKEKAPATANETGTAAAVPVKMPVIPLILAVVVAAMVAVGGAGGAMFWLVRSGRMPLAGGAQKVEAATLPIAKHTVALDPLLVNLADEGGRCYLRVTLTLSVEDKPLLKGEKPAEEKAAKGAKPVVEHEAEIRDAAFSVMGTETTAALLAPDGKENLKSALHKAFAERVPEMKIADIYLTEFLVQR